MYGSAGDSSAPYGQSVAAPVSSMETAWEGWCWSQGYRCERSGSSGEERDPAGWAGWKDSFTEAKLDAELEGGVTGKKWRRWGGAFHTG